VRTDSFHLDRVNGTLEEVLIPVVFVPLTGPNAADPTP